MKSWSCSVEQLQLFSIELHFGRLMVMFNAHPLKDSLPAFAKCQQKALIYVTLSTP
jgi:hypothetical protein